MGGVFVSSHGLNPANRSTYQNMGKGQKQSGSKKSDPKKVTQERRESKQERTKERKQGKKEGRKKY